MRARSIAIFLALLAGCTALPRENYAPISTPISEPPLNSINTSQVGDVMLKQGVYTEHDAIFVPQKIDVGAYVIQAGYYLKEGESDSIESYMPGGNQPGRIDKSMLADNWRCVIIQKGPNPKICVLTIYGTALTTCDSGNHYQRRKVPSLASESFQQTLIYSGKVGNKINIGYREFSNSTARPAFNNDVEYDLSESQTIGYKGARLEIIEATNQAIKYKVISNFNAATR